MYACCTDLGKRGLQGVKYLDAMKNIVTAANLPSAVLHSHSTQSKVNPPVCLSNLHRHMHLDAAVRHRYAGMM